MFTLKRARLAFKHITKRRGKKVGIIVGAKRSGWLLDADSKTFLLQGIGIFENVVHQRIAYLRNSPKLHENMIFETNDTDLLPDIRRLLSSAGYAVFKLESEEAFRNMDMLCNSLVTKRTAIFIHQPLLIHFLEKLQSIIFTRFEDFIFPTTTAFFISRKKATDGIVPVSIAVTRSVDYLLLTLSDRQKKIEIGSILVDKRFMSTGLVYESLKKAVDCEVLLRLLCPRGFKGVYTQLISSRLNEQEVLWPPNSMFSIIRIYRNSDNNIVLDCKLQMS